MLQVLLPAALVAHFRWYGVPWGERLSLAWLGQNFLCLSVYAADASAQALSLQGGTTHDWAYLLGQAGLLDFDMAIAGGFGVLAILSFIALFFMPFFNTRQALRPTSISRLPGGPGRLSTANPAAISVRRTLPFAE